MQLFRGKCASFWLCCVRWKYGTSSNVATFPLGIEAMGDRPVKEFIHWIWFWHALSIFMTSPFWVLCACFENLSHSSTVFLPLCVSLRLCLCLSLFVSLTLSDRRTSRAGIWISRKSDHVLGCKIQRQNSCVSNTLTICRAKGSKVSHFVRFEKLATFFRTKFSKTHAVSHCLSLFLCLSTLSPQPLHHFLNPFLFCSLTT